MRQFLFMILAVGVVAIAAIYGLPYFRQPGIDRLVEQALTASTEPEQVEAAQLLSKLGEPARSGMTQLLTDSSNENVVAISIMGLARLRDYDSMDRIVARLEDPSLSVRSAAANATSKLLGRDHHFPVAGSPAERARIKAQIEKDWKEYNGSELFEHNRKRFDQ